MVQLCQFPRAASRERIIVRTAKRKLSDEAQQRANIKYSWQKLMFRLAANFGPGDLVVTLTYDDDHLPETRSKARAHLKAFRAKMTKSRQARGKDFVAIYATEHLHSSTWIKEDRRWHHHIVINAACDDYEEIRKAWPYGANVEIHRFKLNKELSYETLARYMAKERGETSRSHVWDCTRNCHKPEIESFQVADDEKLTVPDGATHVRYESKETYYGRYDIVSYIGAPT